MARIGNAAGSADFSAKEVVIVMGAGVGCIVLLYWLAKREVKGVVSAVADGASSAAKAVAKVAAPVANAVNPASQTNIVQQLGAAAVRLSDQKAAQQGLTLSTKIVDWFNFGGVNDYDPNADTPKG